MTAFHLNAMAIGLLALSSVLSQLFGVWRPSGGVPPKPVPYDSSQQSILWSEFRGCIRTLFRSAYIGTFVGMMPGLGVSMAGFLGYGAAKRGFQGARRVWNGQARGYSRDRGREQRRHGCKSHSDHRARNTGNVAAALLIAPFIIHGITPGPFMMQTNGELVYALFASMLMANVVHLVIGRFGIPIWVQVTKVPKAIILPVVTVLCVVGVWIPSNSIFEIGIMFVFAALGYIMRKTGFSIVSLFIGFLLGPMLEHTLRQTMVLNDNNVLVFFTQPLALPFTLLTIFFMWRLGTRNL